MSSFNKETTVFEQPYTRNRNNHFSSSSSSFSSNTSSSSRSSNNDEYHTHSHSHSNSNYPVTTQKPSSNSNSTTKARVPFSWEHQPGIPKRPPSSFTKPNSDSSNNGDYSSYSNSPRLPLPPASSTNSKNNHRRKPKHHRITGSTTTTTAAAAANTGTLIWRIDPFLAALVECSKDNITDDDHHNSSNTTTKHHNRNVNNGTLPSIWKGGNDQVVKKNYGGITRSNDQMMNRLGMFNYLYQLSCKRNMMTGSGKTTCGVISDSIVQRPAARSSTSSSSSSSRRLGTYYHGGRRSTSS